MLFSEIKCFIAVAESLNFSDAAYKLGVNQSTVSKSIIRLEETLNCKLFERTTKKVVLTSSGKLFLDISTDFISQCENLKIVNKTERDIVISFDYAIDLRGISDFF